MIGQQQDGSAFAGDDPLPLLFAGLCNGHVASGQRGQQDLVDFSPEGIGLFGHQITQFTGQHRVDIIGRPAGQPGAVLPFQLGKIVAVLGEPRFDDTDRRGQNIRRKPVTLSMWR